MNLKCPGARHMRQPKPESFRCPSCGAEVEIWTDELEATCSNCSQIVRRFQDMSCIEWCKLARECVGENRYNGYMQNRIRSIKGKLIRSIEEHFGEGAERVVRAKKVLEYAEMILEREGGDSHIVIPAAFLLDIGLEENRDASEKAGSNIVRKILLQHGFQKEHIDEICEIILYHRLPGKIDTINFKIVHDAYLLVEDSVYESEMHDKESESIFLTPTGSKISRKDVFPLE